MVSRWLMWFVGDSEKIVLGAASSPTTTAESTACRPYPPQGGCGLAVPYPAMPSGPRGVVPDFFHETTTPFVYVPQGSTLLEFGVAWPW